jgi:hypothetical protein
MSNATTTPPAAETLPLLAHDQGPLEHTWRRRTRDAGEAHVAVILPDVEPISAIASDPLLLYTERQLQDLGADVLRLRFALDARRLEDPETEDRLLADARGALEVALAQGRYTRITLVGSGMGTRLLARLLADAPASLGPKDGRDAKDVRTLWFAPPWKDTTVYDRMLLWKRPALHVIGMLDPQYSAQLQAYLAEKTKAHVLALPRVGRTLDVPGDVDASIAALKATLYATKRFMTLL